jgi:hypothetical protein
VSARRILRGVTAVLALATIYWRWLRPRLLRWGATSVEVSQAMPGDDLVPAPTMVATRGITIESPVEEVWPWIVQMGGYTRGGWYSYDRFDNAGRPSADRIVPELQDLAVGDVMLTSQRGGFTVRRIDPGRSIVLEIEHDGSQITSVPVLTPLPGGRTRLVFRVRAYFRPKHWLFALALDVGDYVFMRKQLLEIKKRAEAR